MKKAIYKLHIDYGRMGELEGVLISTKEKVDKLIETGMEVYFGEVLGKHSEVYCSINKGDLTFVSDNEEAVRVLEEHDLTSGYNPFHYTITGGVDGLEDEDLDDVSVGEIVEKLLKK